MAATAAAAMDDDGDDVGTTTLFAAVAAVIGWALAVYCFIKKRALDDELENTRTMLETCEARPQPQVFTQQPSHKKPVAQPLPKGVAKGVPVAQPLSEEELRDTPAGLARPVAQPVSKAAAPVPPLMLRFAP